LDLGLGKRGTPLHLHKLTHDGTAKVVSCELHIGKLISGGLTNQQGWDWTPYDFILDVYPEGGQPFRTEVRKHFGSGHHPQAGDTLKVRCNPKKQTVEIDVSEDERFNRSLYHGADKRRAEEEHERLRNAAPGTPAPGSFDRQARLAELLKSGASPDPLADLTQLLKRGVITQAEFDARKAELPDPT
jgi:Short C-terminal domain